MSSIKASPLLRHTELASLGAILHMIIEEVERLEAVEENAKNNARKYIADHNRDEPPPECERTPLRHSSPLLEGLFLVVRDRDNAFVAMRAGERDAREFAEACDFPCSVVRVMEPEGNECPTERIAPEDYEWGIIKIADGTIFWCSHHHNFYSSANILNETARFPSKAAAADSIAECGMTDCQPWPIPPKSPS